MSRNVNAAMASMATLAPNMKGVPYPLLGDGGSMSDAFVSVGEMSDDTSGNATSCAAVISGA